MTAAVMLHLLGAANAQSELERKAALFDTLTDAFTNRWHDGKWSWFPHTACGGKECETKEEAIADLIAWAERNAARNRKKFGE